LRVPPTASADWDLCDPVYKTLPGWLTSTSGTKRFRDLPQNARDYVDFIAKSTGARVKIVSVGPARSQTIRC